MSAEHKLSGVRGYTVVPCARVKIKEFVEQWHYSKSINGIKSSYCFALYDGATLIGGMIYGKMSMANQWKRFGKTEDDVIELRRLCCIDDTPRNTESYFIGSSLRWLRKNTELKIVVSYADTEQGHQGTIYKASNFSCLGWNVGARVIFWEGKKYHDKAIRAKYKGALKPFAIRLKAALDEGAAKYQKTAGKITYVYVLKG